MVNAVLGKPTIKIIFSQVGDTVISFRREEYAAHVASMVVTAIESPAAFVLWLALLFIVIFRFVSVALIKP